MHAIVARLLGFVASLAVVALLAAPAHAGRDPWRPVHHPPSHSAPEIDPAGAGAIVTLLVGGTMLLRSRRSAR